MRYALVVQPGEYDADPCPKLHELEASYAMEALVKFGYGVEELLQEMSLLPPDEDGFFGWRVGEDSVLYAVDSDEDTEFLRARMVG